MPTEFNPVLASDDQLLAEVIELSEYRAQTYLTQQRKEEFSKRIGRIVFEINCRREDDGFIPGQSE